MRKTVEFLKEKNGYLEKFLGLNREWLDRLSRGDFGAIEEFRETRENILNIIRHIDLLVETQIEQTPEDAMISELPVAYELRDQVNLLLERKDSLVRAILAQDLDIMQIIEQAKSQIIKELKKVSRGKKTIGSYKSFNRKETVDEEA